MTFASFTPTLGLPLYKIHIFMNKIKEKKYLLSEADKYRFFEKIFKELKIALVDSDHVCRVKYSGHYWLRQCLCRSFLTIECCGYKFGRYAVVWKGLSNIPLFIMEFDCPFDIFSIKEYDFLLRKEIQGLNNFERYTWQPSTGQYLITTFPPEIAPEEFTNIRQRHYPEEHPWCRIFPHKNAEVKSTDNTIFYDFIVKYRQ